MIQLIINRFETCNCGCNGSDPWHKKVYRRKVKEISAIEGTVRLPFSTKPVRVTRRIYGEISFGLWIVDRDSIIFDKY